MTLQPHRFWLTCLFDFTGIPWVLLDLNQITETSGAVAYFWPDIVMTELRCVPDSGVVSSCPHMNSLTQ